MKNNAKTRNKKNDIQRKQLHVEKEISEIKMHTIRIYKNDGGIKENAENRELQTE